MLYYLQEHRVFFLVSLYNILIDFCRMWAENGPKMKSLEQAGILPEGCLTAQQKPKS